MKVILYLPGFNQRASRLWHLAGSPESQANGLC